MTVNQNVNASNLLLVCSRTAQITPTDNGKNSDATGFADVLANSSRKVSAQESNLDVKKDNADPDVKQPTDNVKQAHKITERQTDDSSTESKAVENDTEISNPAVDDDISKENLEQAVCLLTNVVLFVMDQTQMSFGELNEQLENLGMDWSDLTNFEGIKDFFLQTKGIDASDLLVDETLNQELQSFIQEWQDILAVQDVPVDDVSQIIDSVDEDLLDDMITTHVIPVEETNGEPVTERMPDEGKMVQDNAAIFTDSYPKEQVITKVNISNDPAGQQNESYSQQDAESTTEDMVKVQDITETKEVVNPILQNIQDALNKVTLTEHTDNVNKPQPVVEQIVEQVRVHMNQDATSMELQLYPEHLGKIQIHVVSKDGVMTARIAAETEQAKQAIENGLANLKEAFEQQDLKVEAVEVMVSTAGFEKGQDQQERPEQKRTGGKTGKLVYSDTEEEELEEQAETERMRMTGSSVSYTA